MPESLFPTIESWLTRFGARWRLSTWWISDTRDSMQQSLLRLLATAHRERLDVTPLVTNLAEEHRGSYRRRLRRLSRRLSDGTPVVEALEETPDTLRDEDVLAIRFGSQTGTLGAVYESLVNDSLLNADASVTLRRQTWIYAIITVIALFLSIGFLLLFIVPMLKAMSEEFGLSGRSVAFQTFMEFTDWIVANSHLLVLAVVAIAFLVWSAPSRRFFRRVFAGRFVRGTGQKRSSQLLQLLSTTVEAGRPVPAAISALARYHFDRGYRQKLLFARNEIEQGTDVWTSLTDARLLTPPESNAISHASSLQSRAWTMRELAETKRRTLVSRGEGWTRFLQPAVTILFAGVVLLTGAAMIGFLSKMIQSLSEVV